MKREPPSPRKQSRRHLAASLSAVVLAAGAGAADLPPADWMSRLPRDTRLSALSIPGSHNAGARFEPLAGTAKCQDATLADQLGAGVRFLDLRCRHQRDSFAIYHGMMEQRLTFDAALDQIAGFLKVHPGECVLLSVKEEHKAAENSRTFEATFDSYVAKAPDRWWLGTRIPSLGDARGRMVLVRRFAAAAAKGIDASHWPDNDSFRTAQLAVQDCYQVPDVEAKWRRIETALEAARADTASGRLHLNFASGYRPGALGIPNVTAVVGGIGPRLRAWFERAPAGHYGCVIMDFVDAGTCAAIIRTHVPESGRRP